MSNFKRRYTPELEKIAQDAPTRRKPKVAPAPTAQAPAPAKPGGAPTRRHNSPAAPHGGTAPAGGQHGFPASAEVRTMQEALLNLANTASSTDVTAMDGNKEGVMEGKQIRQIPAVESLPNKFGPDGQLARPDGQMGDQQQHELSQQTKDDKNYLGGSDPFGKFLVQNYIKPDSFIGKQYLNVDVAGQAKRENASMNPTNLRGIIDTIKRIGSPNAKGERVVDGVWQTRTNNALHVVADLVEAIMGLSTDMGVKLTAYNPGYLTKFRQLVPDSWNMMKSQEEVNKRAEVITQHLNAMTKMFQQFNNDVLNNKTIRQFIDQHEAFANFPKENQVPQGVDPTASLPGVKLNWSQNPNENTVSIYDLSSLDNFKKFLQRLRVLGQNPSNDDVKKMLDHVNNAISQQSPRNTKFDPGY